MERVDERRTEGIGITDCCRLDALEIAGLRSGQQILAVVNRRIAELSKEVPSVHGVLRGVRPVHTPDDLVLVAGLRDSILYFAAGVVGHGKIVGGQLQRRLVQLTRGYFIAWIRQAGGRIFQRDGLPVGLARSRRHGAQIPAQCRRRGDNAEDGGRLRAVARPLKAAKEEQLIGDDLSAQRAAEDVPLQTVVHRREEVSRVQIPVTKIFE